MRSLGCGAPLFVMTLPASVALAAAQGGGETQAWSLALFMVGSWKGRKKARKELKGEELRSCLEPMG